MTNREFRRAAKAMGMSVAEMGRRLGLATASYKNYATGARPIPAYVERSVRAHLLLHREGLIEKLPASTKDRSR